jgi:hypothetical protein
LGFRYRRKAFLDLRSVPKAGRPREQVENHGRACCTKETNLGDALGLFRFMINFPTCFTISKARVGRVEPDLATSSYILGPLFWECPHTMGHFYTLDMISAKKTKQENQTGKETNYFHKLGKVKRLGL